MEIKQIDKNWLIKLEPLLSKSFGEPVLMKDEIEYFENKKPKNWFVALNKRNQPIGFIRDFPITTSFSYTELYGIGLDTEKNLIDRLDSRLKNTSLQFRIQKANSKLIAHIEGKEGIAKTEEFAEYIFSDKLTAKKTDSVRFAQTTKEEIPQIIEILSELKHHSKSEILDLVQDERIAVIKKNGNIIGTSLVNLNDNSIDIVEIAIKNSYRNQGFGKELLEGVLHLYYDKHPSTFFKLKVEKENIAAIELYRKVGFRENKQNDELWLTKKYL